MVASSHFFDILHCNCFSLSFSLVMVSHIHGNSFSVILFGNSFSNSNTHDVVKRRTELHCTSAKCKLSFRQMRLFPKCCGFIIVCCLCVSGKWMPFSKYCDFSCVLICIM